MARYLPDEVNCLGVADYYDFVDYDIDAGVWVSAFDINRRAEKKEEISYIARKRDASLEELEFLWQAEQDPVCRKALGALVTDWKKRNDGKPGSELRDLPGSYYSRFGPFKSLPVALEPPMMFHGCPLRVFPRVYMTVCYRRPSTWDHSLRDKVARAVRMIDDDTFLKLWREEHIPFHPLPGVFTVQEHEENVRIDIRVYRDRQRYVRCLWAMVIPDNSYTPRAQIGAT